ncbi:MAG: hypothetical protein A2504_07990 [Bdellovibrionales bacterium RIFOXYD12_FULL_39_22]|nr:MAG: hypothetical protein A2385_13615 [Bdellovibrionales bacterium RIFOXYB1_FULL_39_21]OFZ44871.1 MAG: hypothetical protein A2485_14825 [Bdellovibrionales bacterium RIFOXYC12_FULL_39_17]OFZ49389.1 MAG: hypothetical protein A2404_09160 [Bdellovibrionales bacterium RIFOXYC1_FULL_39_130]OFZ73906.1 MAG: hypothetical protein A2451_07760 [Bdellovibrionales bacterium RIFOXYC2_FULL_39_8]OFZ77110.1 MAG: hypothetical protein A2560_10810 [Bdellovibrionales bacterium RIFOXYD1_FULL_39_84]OFZ95571.1 MAG:
MSLVLNREAEEISRILGAQPRSPLQYNHFNQSDCEILKLSSGKFLISNIDSVSDEILFGLYREPYTMGWISVMGCLSDFAASGVRPEGILISTLWGVAETEKYKMEVNRGIADALASCRVSLLGGDSGLSKSTSIIVSAATVTDYPPIMRSGACNGDWVCLVGKTGVAAAMALDFLQGGNWFIESNFRPVAQLDQGIALNALATSIIDTSDGILQSLNILGGLSKLNFALEWKDNLVDPLALEFCRKRDIPKLLLWIAEHGDYQLLLTISPEKLSLAKKLVPTLYTLGRVTTNPSSVMIDGKSFEFNISEISDRLFVNRHNRPALLAEFIYELKR